MMNVTRVPLFALAAMLLLAGCGGEGGSQLTGLVTYNGAPVEQGAITFTPLGTGSTFGANVAGGKYTVEKAQVGKFTAIVSSASENPRPRTREEAAQQKAPPANYIPDNASGNSVEVAVAGGSQSMDFTITGPPRP